MQTLQQQAQRRRRRCCCRRRRQDRATRAAPARPPEVARSPAAYICQQRTCAVSPHDVTNHHRQQHCCYACSSLCCSPCSSAHPPFTFPAHNSAILTVPRSSILRDLHLAYLSPSVQPHRGSDSIQPFERATAIAPPVEHSHVDDGAHSVVVSLR